MIDALWQRHDRVLNRIKIITEEIVSNKGTTACAPGRCIRLLASDWNRFYFYTLHSILFTILVAAHWIVVIMCKLDMCQRLRPNTLIARYSKNYIMTVKWFSEIHNGSIFSIFCQLYKVKDIKCVQNVSRTLCNIIMWRVLKRDNRGHLHTLWTSEKEQQEKRSRQTGGQATVANKTGRRRRPSGAGSLGDYRLVNSIALVTFFVTTKWIILAAFIDRVLYKTWLNIADTAAGLGWRLLTKKPVIFK